MKLFFILGNQLFPLKYLDRFKKDHTFYMAEDYGLCTYEKHHKQKILLFLSSMRSYAENLKRNKLKLDYIKIEDKEFKDSYFKKLKKVITQKKITEISSFEVEDKFFEKKISQFLKKEKINWNIVQTPMFLNSRDEFKSYLAKSKKPFMATFYKEVRKKSGILMGADGNPIGGKWSFDEDNRNKLPKDMLIPKFPKINETHHTKKLKPIIEKLFKDHPGSTNNFWLATEYNDAILIVENNNIGWATIQQIIDRDYPNLFYTSKDLQYVDIQHQMNNRINRQERNMVAGFSTTSKTRPLIISKLEEFFREESVVVHSNRLIDELQTFVYINNRAEAMSGYNDDLVMSFAIGLWVRDTALRLRTEGIELTKKTLSRMQDNEGLYTPNDNKNDSWEWDTGKEKESIEWLL